MVALSERETSDTADFLIVAAFVSAAATMIVVPVLDARSRLLAVRKEAGQPDTGLASAVGLVALAVLITASLLLPIASVVVPVVSVLF